MKALAKARDLHRKASVKMQATMAYQRCADAARAVDAAVLAVKSDCPHPEEDREDFKWHHGYGKYVTGVRCRLCGRYRPWSPMGAWTDQYPSITRDD